MFQKLRIDSFNELNYAIEINTGKTNSIDALGKSVSRGVHKDITFVNFKAHKFSYLNITSLGTDYVLNGTVFFFTGYRLNAKALLLNTKHRSSFTVQLTIIFYA